uniref:BRCT domain-containing protein n=1 Tax=Lotharella oceanica TaxID=641309 RepID=A0A7S2XC25_9EUKA|mmetsp:Transcript_22049/g.41323  ORF Transcript_22049/g.41323 Transcript_22049/m.41323 type:complete len:348 (+) Transcript_22049:334-1377(+)
MESEDAEPSDVHVTAVDIESHLDFPPHFFVPETSLAGSNMPSSPPRASDNKAKKIMTDLRCLEVMQMEDEKNICNPEEVEKSNAVSNMSLPNTASQTPSKGKHISANVRQDNCPHTISESKIESVPVKKTKLLRSKSRRTPKKKIKFEDLRPLPRRTVTIPRVVITGIKGQACLEDAMRQLGATILSANNARKCTHLISTRILRTEKFLCAFSNARYVLKPTWISSCLDKGCIHPPTLNDYLNDRTSELQYSFELSTSMKAPRSKVFMGHKFYFDRKIGADFRRVLSNIVMSGGASAVLKSRRVVNGLIVVVSKDEKFKIFKIAAGSAPVLTTEDIILATLRQKFIV